MTVIRCELKEKIRVESVAGDYPETILTDVGAAYGGRAEVMGATEVLAVAVGNCIVTMMALAAAKQGVSIEGAVAEVTKKLAQDPHLRVSELAVVVKLPAVDDSKRPPIEEAALHCPVHRSLHPDVKAPVSFEWGVC